MINLPHSRISRVRDLEWDLFLTGGGVSDLGGAGRGSGGASFLLCSVSPFSGSGLAESLIGVSANMMDILYRKGSIRVRPDSMRKNHGRIPKLRSSFNT